MPVAGYPRERTLPGMMQRLLSEDWTEMTRLARDSSLHVSRLARWEAIVREANPGRPDAEVTRLAEMLRTEHYRRMARLSHQARRLNARVATELRHADEMA